MNQLDEQRTDGKLEAGAVTANSPFLRWLDNFWYHHKWTVIISLFFAIVLIMGLVQILSQESYDVKMTYGGRYRMDDDERADFEALLNTICPDDYDGDGKKHVQYMIYEVFSEEEILQAKAEAESQGQDFVFNVKYNSDEFENFTAFAGTGECSVYFLSPYLYEVLKSSDRIRPVAELYGDRTLPDGVLEDGYGVALKDTDFYEYHSAAQVLPEDTIVCLLRSTVWNTSGGRKEAYARAEALFRAIVDFSVIG
jgi:hypothetical protein